MIMMIFDDDVLSEQTNTELWWLDLHTFWSRPHWKILNALSLQFCCAEWWSSCEVLVIALWLDSALSIINWLLILCHTCHECLSVLRVKGQLDHTKVSRWFSWIFDYSQYVSVATQAFKSFLDLYFHCSCKVTSSGWKHLKRNVYNEKSWSSRWNALAASIISISTLLQKIVWLSDWHKNPFDMFFWILVSHGSWLPSWSLSGSMWLHWSSWQTLRNFFFKHLFRNISVAKWIASRCQLKDSSTLKTIPHYTLHKPSITNSQFKSNISAISPIASS